MPKSPAKSLTSTASSPRTRASIQRVTLRRFGHGGMGPGRPASGPGGLAAVGQPAPVTNDLPVRGWYWAPGTNLKDSRLLTRRHWP